MVLKTVAKYTRIDTELEKEHTNSTSTSSKYTRLKSKTAHNVKKECVIRSMKREHANIGLNTKLVTHLSIALDQA